MALTGTRIAVSVMEPPVLHALTKSDACSVFAIMFLALSSCTGCGLAETTASNGQIPSSNAHCEVDAGVVFLLDSGNECLPVFVVIHFVVNGGM